MAADKKNPENKPPLRPGGEKKAGDEDKAESPEWANGLRQLYDSVVDEPLPDSFKDLLSKLDESDSKNNDAGLGKNS